MGKKKRTRHEERQTVMGLLFSSAFRKDENPESILLDLEDDGTSDYIESVFVGAYGFIPEADVLIEEDSKNWKISRLSPVTAAILHLGVYEMLNTDIPPKVAINESVELAKEYDDGSSPAFVNGILNRIARDRGLIG